MGYVAFDDVWFALLIDQELTDAPVAGSNVGEEFLSRIRIAGCPCLLRLPRRLQANFRRQEQSDSNIAARRITVRFLGLAAVAVLHHP